jgi:hypothetical protein
MKKYVIITGQEELDAPLWTDSRCPGRAFGFDQDDISECEAFGELFIASYRPWVLESPHSYTIFHPTVGQVRVDLTPGVYGLYPHGHSYSQQELDLLKEKL